MIFEMIKTIIVVATIYHADPAQCNADYLTTASMKTINENNPQGHRWIAVSRDLEEHGFKFGAKVRVSGAGKLDGIWTVEDRMNKRYTKRIDFLVNKEMTGGKWNNVKIILVNEKV